MADTENKKNEVRKILSRFHLLNATKYLGNCNIVVCVLKNLLEKLFDFRSKLTEIIKSFSPFLNTFFDRKSSHLEYLRLTDGTRFT